MNPRIASIENLIATDPGGRNVFALLVTDQLRLAAQSLRLARRVAIVSGFYVPEAGAGETDGPPGAKMLGEALNKIGVEVDYITDRQNEPLFRALGLKPIVLSDDSPDACGVAGVSRKAEHMAGYIRDRRPTHLLAIERLGRGSDGRYRNARGLDVTDSTEPLDLLFIEGSKRGVTTIGIGDGGNEIGMGKVFVNVLDTADPSLLRAQVAESSSGAASASTVSTDFCVVAGVSNWGAYGLAGALSVLEGRELLPTAMEAAGDVERLVEVGGAVDGLTHRREPTVDGLGLSYSLRMLENIRRQTVSSPLESGESLLVGILGYGDTARSAAKLLHRHGHRVCISDQNAVTIDPGSVVAGVETGGHSIEFLGDCDLVVTSPGVRVDAPIRNELHLRGIPVVSELELAYQLCAPKLIAVTGTIGKRTTVELLERLFAGAGRALPIGGNRGKPLSELALESDCSELMAVAVSSFQLETVVHLRPRVSILLNIDDEHLDRHRTIAEYVRIKSRIFMNHQPEDVLILNFDDRRLRPLARKHAGRTWFVSAVQSVDRGAWLADGCVWANVQGSVEQLGEASAEFPENLLSAVLAARASGISAAAVSEGLKQLREADVML